MNESELKEVLRLHKMWLDSEPDGKRANLHEADLREVNLGGADLRGADMCGVHLYTANLRGADLRGADMRSAGLRWADLRGVDMRWANLRDANLREANLSYTNLSEANLREADMRWANLSGTNLSGANLRGTDMRDANLDGTLCGCNAFFGSVKGAPFYQAVCGFGRRNAALTLLAQGERTDWRWFTGCFEGSEEELRAAVSAKHGANKAGKGYLLAIDYLVAQAELNARNSY